MQEDLRECAQLGASKRASLTSKAQTTCPAGCQSLVERDTLPKSLKNELELKVGDRLCVSTGSVSAGADVRSTYESAKPQHSSG